MKKILILSPVLGVAILSANCGEGNACKEKDVVEEAKYALAFQLWVWDNKDKARYYDVRSIFENPQEKSLMKQRVESYVKDIKEEDFTKPDMIGNRATCSALFKYRNTRYKVIYEVSTEKFEKREIKKVKPIEVNTL